MQEAPQSRRRKKFLLAFLVCSLAGIAVAVHERAKLAASYYAYRMEKAAEGERQVWADRLVELGEPGAKKLLGCFRKDDVDLCLVARESLEKLLKSWGNADPRCGKVADAYFEMHPTFSVTGQIAAILLLPEILVSGAVEVNARARTIVSASLRDHTPELRYVGIAAATRSEINLLPMVVPLLDDPEPKIRRAAILVLGPLKDNATDQPIVSSDKLLKWLHDSNAEVREVCVGSLKSRGLSDVELRLGKMLTHPDPSERLNLLLDLPQEEKVDLAVWLRRLSSDDNSAVRAGAARVAAEHRVDFADRLEEMTRTDPDETVRQIAEHYERFYHSNR